MPLSSGTRFGSLAELIADARVRGPGTGLPVAEALAIARQIAGALEAVHEAAIVQDQHRLELGGRAEAARAETMKPEDRHTFSHET